MTKLPDHLPPNVSADGKARETDGGGAETRFAARAGASVHQMERELIMTTLAATGGNRTRAAEMMGMSRRALPYKIKRYGIGD